MTPLYSTKLISNLNYQPLLTVGIYLGDFILGRQIRGYSLDIGFKTLISGSAVSHPSWEPELQHIPQVRKSLYEMLAPTNNPDISGNRIENGVLIPFNVHSGESFWLL